MCIRLCVLCMPTFGHDQGSILQMIERILYTCMLLLCCRYELMDLSSITLIRLVRKLFHRPSHTCGVDHHITTNAVAVSAEPAANQRQCIRQQLRLCSSPLVVRVCVCALCAVNRPTFSINTLVVPACRPHLHIHTHTASVRAVRGATSLAGSGQHHNQHDHQAPVFQHEPTGWLPFSNDSGAQLYCAAHGTPAPLVTWVLKDGSPVSTVSGLRQLPGNGTLYFPPFAGQYYRGDVHVSVYRCRASNAAGTILSRDVHVNASE